MQAYLQVALKVADKNGEAVAGVYTKSKAPSLTDIAGAKSKSLLIRDEDVQVLHGFSNKEAAEAYLNNAMFSNDVAGELGPCWTRTPTFGYTRLTEAHVNSGLTSL